MIEACVRKLADMSDILANTLGSASNKDFSLYYFAYACLIYMILDNCVSFGFLHTRTTCPKI